MAKTIRILILEDDLGTLAKLFEKLAHLEDGHADKGLMISTVVLSEYQQVEDLINKSKLDFDVIFLDRDCKAGGSFHILDIEAIGVDKTISISSIPQYNEEASKRGVKHIVWKDYQKLDDFSDKVIKELEEILRL